MEEKDNEFISFKKVIILGTEGSGKSTLTNSLETRKFSELTHSENSKLI